MYIHVWIWKLSTTQCPLIINCTLVHLQLEVSPWRLIFPVSNIRCLLTGKKKFLTLFKTVKMLSSWTWYTIIQLPIYFLWKKWIWRALDFQYLLSLPQELSVFGFGLLKVKRDSLNIQLTFRNFTEACKFNLDTCLAYYLSDIIKSNSKTINTTLEAPNGHIYMFR